MSDYEQIRVTFRRVHVLMDADDVGSGNWYFIATVDGDPVGDRNRIFDAEDGRSIPLDERQWQTIIDVRGRDLNSMPVIVRFQVKDFDDLSPDDALGSVTRTLRSGRSQGNFRRYQDDFALGFFTLDWRVEFMVSGQFGFEHPTYAVFATRQHPGSVSCTTISGRSFMARMEICPVIPLPPDPDDMPPRPQRAGALMGIFPVTNREDGTIVRPDSPINIIPNPSAIPILNAADLTAAELDNQAARIEFTYYDPPTLNFTNDDPRLEWSISGQGDAAQLARFFGPGSTPDGCHSHGTKVMVYGTGTAEGEVLLEMRFQGALFATYRALVLPVRQIRYRANILNGLSGSQPRSRPEHVRDHILIANRFLRQMAIELVPDPDDTVTDGAEPTEFPGIFRIRVAQGVTRNIPVGDWPRATRLNYRQGVFNFAYIHSDHNGNFGAATDYPASDAGMNIRDNGTPSTSWIRRSGIPPDIPVDPVEMDLLLSRERQAPRWRVFPQLFAMYVTNGCGDPDFAWNQLTYGYVIAHELGHVLNLGHRGEFGEFGDGLIHPARQNVMCQGRGALVSQDFDIIQTRAVHQSPLVRPRP